MYKHTMNPLKLRWDQFVLDGINSSWDQLGWDQMGWDQLVMGSNGMGSSHMGCFSWDQLVMGSIGMGSTGRLSYIYIHFLIICLQKVTF